MPEEQDTIEVSHKAFEKLTWAKKKDESYSDVIIRLVSDKLDGLQRRGEKEIVTQDNKRFILSVEQGKCMGAESCVELAPEVFALDYSNLGFIRNEDAPLAMKDVMDREVPSEKIVIAVQSCPYKAITLKDAETGEQLFP